MRQAITWLLGFALNSTYKSLSWISIQSSSEVPCLSIVTEDPISLFYFIYEVIFLSFLLYLNITIFYYMY